MDRSELQALEIILDEQAPRIIAKERGLSIVGFAGILIRSCREGHLTAEIVRDIMLECQSQGTHYATSFIDGIYQKLKEEMQLKKNITPHEPQEPLLSSVDEAFAEADASQQRWSNGKRKTS